MDFEWDPKKAKTNLKKHGVSFMEAVDVFYDTLSSTVPDPDVPESESRFLIFGQTYAGKYLVVSFTERDNSLHLISARHMTPPERKAYEQ